ncbi:VirE2 family protein [Ensifer sp. YR511]|uniref:VirE2 family protein n=1 Tax=Ensifer sp. YR511 TaxID=1855294 RepID=UPI00088F69FB|nr:VirE2 family protein [Ensifer sp. YR511]SDO05606.1 VirE2 protein [Ensifer sp. YR511]
MRNGDDYDSSMGGADDDAGSSSGTPLRQTGSLAFQPTGPGQLSGPASGFPGGYNPYSNGFNQGSSSTQQYGAAPIKQEEGYTAPPAFSTDYEPFTYGFNSAGIKLEDEGIGRQYWDEAINQFSNSANHRAVLSSSEDMLFADPGRASNDDFAWLTGKQLMDKYPGIAQRRADDAMKLIKAENGNYYPEAQYYNSITAPGCDYNSTDEAYRQYVYRQKMQGFGVTPTKYSGAVFNHRTGQYQLSGADAYMDTPGGKRYRQFEYKFPEHAGVNAPDFLYRNEDGTFRGKYRHENDEFTGKSPEEVKVALKATSLHLKSSTNIYQSTEHLGPEFANTRFKGYVNESRAHNKNLPKAVVDIGPAHIDVDYILAKHSEGALAQMIRQRDPEIILRTRVLMPGGNTYMPVTRLKQMSEKNHDGRYQQALSHTSLPKDFGFIDWQHPANRNRPKTIRDDSAVLVHMNGMLLKGEALQKILGPGKTIEQYASKDTILVQSQQRNKEGHLYNNGNYKNLANLQDHEVPVVAAAMIQGRHMTPAMQYGQWAQYQPQTGGQPPRQNWVPPSRQPNYSRNQPNSYGSRPEPQNYYQGQSGPQGYYRGNPGLQQQRGGYQDSQQEPQKAKQPRVFDARSRNGGWGL